MTPNFRDRKLACKTYFARSQLLARYGNRRHDRCHEKKIADDRALDAIKAAFIAGWKRRREFDDSCRYSTHGAF
jgi:hypothetical protein